MRPRTTSSARSRRRSGRGFTVIELIIALSLGAIVLAGAIGYMIRGMRTLAGNEIRQSLARNARYVGVSLRHDLQKAGIEIESTVGFGTVNVWPGTVGDTLVILHVPYLPDIAPAHPLAPPAGNDNPLPPGGTCGPRCVDIVVDSARPLELAPGDLARLQVLGTRRLILVEQITSTSDTSVALTFTDAPILLRQPAGLSGGLLLDRYGTYVQKLAPIVYYLDDEEQLRRAVRLNMDGSPAGDVLAYGVEQFDVKLLFADGDVLERADPTDTDLTNDFDDIVAVRIRVTMKAERADPHVNQGRLLRRSYEWTISPRNLRYEKNRT
jgi:prepilin-type N-terminal cleavage/methylation domain-containing protein